MVDGGLIPILALAPYSHLSLTLKHKAFHHHPPIPPSESTIRFQFRVYDCRIPIAAMPVDNTMLDTAMCGNVKLTDLIYTR